MAGAKSAQAKYEYLQQAQFRVCPAGRRWALAHPRLTTAWRACRNGHWMAWWLFENTDVSSTELFQLARTIKDQFNVNAYTGIGWTPEESLQFAKLLRATYNPTGTRRQA